MPDITISFTIPSAKVTKAREGYLRSHPKPGTFAGTDKEWITRCVRRDFVDTVKDGLRNIAHAELVVEDDYTEP